MILTQIIRMVLYLMRLFNPDQPQIQIVKYNQISNRRLALHPVIFSHQQFLGFSENDKACFGEDSKFCMNLDTHEDDRSRLHH